MDTPEVGPRRLLALDGLRGAAALVVVVHHALLTIPSLALPYFGSDATTDANSFTWWLIYSPLHLFWNGTAAVYLFFVLSGVVLTLPVIRTGPDYNWGRYYIQRIVRIYVPVWAAVLLAALNIALFHRGPNPSRWVDANQDPISAAAVINDLGLLTQRGFLASPLWSLHWEILFSLLLPVSVWIALQLGRHSMLLLPFALGAVAAGDRLAIPELKFMPMFLIGTVLAVLIHSRLDDHRHSSLWTVAGVLASLAACSPWIVRGLHVGASLRSIAEALAVAACAVLLLSSICSRAIRSCLERRPLQFLGRISFSLYLVHEPIVIAFASVGLAPAVAIPVSIGLSLCIAVAFYKLIEQPSHRLARRAAQRPMRTPPLRARQLIRPSDSTMS